MMILRRAIIMGVLAILASQGPANAGLYEKGGANGLGARAMGMAGAYTALATDETAVWWNPAGLGELTKPRLGTSLGSLYDGQLRSINLSAAMPLPKGSAAGINWTHDAYLESADIQTDALALAGSLPLSQDKRLRLGAGIKILFGSIPKIEQVYSGVGLDLGLRYSILFSEEQKLDLAIKIQDLDTRIEWSNGVSEQVPQSIALGSAYHFDRFTVAVMDLEMVHSGQDEGKEVRILRMGMERWFRDIIGLRAGYILDSDHASTFSLGAGIKVSGWEVQYALLGEVANLGISHRLTLSYGLPSLPAQVKPIAPIPVPTAVAVALFKYELIALPEVFSPSGETLTDSVVFHMNLIEGDWTQVATWRLRLENTGGEVVREFAGNQYTDQFEWDGLDRQGKVCPDGAYEATLVMMDDKNRALGQASVSVLIRTEMPDVGIRINPRRLLLVGKKPQRAIRLRVINAAALSGVTWNIEVQNSAGTPVKAFDGEGTVTEEIKWNGIMNNQKMIRPGTYEVILSIADTIGQFKTSTQTFSVQQVAPKIRMSVSPRMIKIGDQKLGKATFTVSVQPNVGVENWRMDIRNAQSKAHVRTIRGKGAPPKNIIWDAKDKKAKNVKPGSYFHARLILSYGQKSEVKGPKIALATDIGTEATGRSLALHLTMTTFRSGSSTIQLTDFKRLKQASETVKKYAKKYRLQIKGYTDNREAKKNELELSWERARKVKEYLNVSCGIPNDRMEIVGYGSRLPLAPETSAAGRAKNRRVEVVLIIQK
jgi:outer membrane protein OmpA-like peptidoglycan-associated protein